MNIPGFQLGRQVADGQFCKGYNALNLSNSKTVNIQVFDPALLSREPFVKQFQEITHLLEGTNFGIMVPILHAEISQQGCYIIYDYFPNPQQLSALPTDLTTDQILKLGLQLAQTLDQLHQAGLVHGGIENCTVFFQKDGTPALRPLMMQRVMPSLWPSTYDNLEIKQRLYLAPEAKEKLTPSTDFYALGILLYQMLFETPVIDNADRIQTGKHFQSLQQQSFDINGTDMSPLFKGLLSPDAANRIQNYSQFYSTLEQCGIELSEIAITPASSTHRSHTSQNKKSISQPGVKWGIAAAALVVTAVMGIVIYWLPAQPVDVELTVANAPATLASTLESTKKIEPSDQSTEDVNDRSLTVKPQSIETLYQQALAQVELNPGSALMSVNTILGEDPNHSGALKLKGQIEKNIAARSIIDKAERQLAEFKLLKPSGDNAYESYQALADKLSLNDDRVQQGFTHIAAAYYKQAEYLFQQGALEKAQQNVALGLYVKEGYPPLIELGIRINEKEREKAQKLKIAQLEKTRLADQQQLQRQQELKRQKDQEQRDLEQKRLAEELKQHQQAQAAKVARRNEQLIQQQEEQKARDLKIDNLLLSANGYLNRGLLKLDAVFAAHMNYDEMRQLEVENEKVRRLKQDIIDAYSMLAGRYDNDGLIEKAIRSIEQGIQMSEQDRKRFEVRSRLIR